MLAEVLAASVRPDLIVGVSAGAINGAYLASDPVPSRAELLAGLWAQLRTRDVLGARLFVTSLCPLARAAHDYSGGAELIRTARASTHAWLKSGGLQRSELPHELLDHVH
jgi:predicted acylesterase/phospholipase RssA